MVGRRGPRADGLRTPRRRRTVNLVAAPFTKVVTLPNGTTVSVPMWGYSLDVDGNCADRRGRGGDRPRAADRRARGTTSLTINLTNLPAGRRLRLSSPASSPRATPRRTVDGRIRSMAAETAPRSDRHVHVHRPEAGHLPVPERLPPGRAGPDGPLRRDDAELSTRRPAPYPGVPVHQNEAAPCLQRNRPGAAPGGAGRHLRHPERAHEHDRLPAVALPHQRRVVHERVDGDDRGRHGRAR